MVNHTPKDTMRSQELDQPPTYDASVAPTSDTQSPKTTNRDVKADAISGNNWQQFQPPAMTAGPSYSPMPLNGQTPRVYNYVNPRTGERVVSLLPPDHPEMICLQAGQHVTRTDYGILGILAAIIWFPLGIGLCLLDKRVKCQRCGLVLENGVCH
ncbi:hypothetical protein CPB83DRAFT_805236 [Crepidotus variabilis]|uniref:Brain protein I3 n=1 Tax=Crepidotus variabilis TaxID=179855 RepID=A0A9P6JUW4_9AGAR|nr:hypothetical protein CPB83DRAFT_805236 [Crepidotus variabilis]